MNGPGREECAPDLQLLEALRWGRVILKSDLYIYCCTELLLPERAGPFFAIPDDFIIKISAGTRVRYADVQAQVYMTMDSTRTRFKLPKWVELGDVFIMEALRS